MGGVSTRFHSYLYLYLVVIVIVLLLSLNSATSRPLPPQTTLQPQAQGSSSSKEQEAGMTINKEEGVGVQEVIGSRPPRCDHRCKGCSPCEATQVPTNHHVGIQFTNYEPEGWKCKCGPSFFTP